MDEGVGPREGDWHWYFVFSSCPTQISLEDLHEAPTPGEESIAEHPMGTNKGGVKQSRKNFTDPEKQDHFSAAVLISCMEGLMFSC